MYSAGFLTRKAPANRCLWVPMPWPASPACANTCPAGTTTYPLSVFTGIAHSVKAQHVTIVSVPIDVLQDVTCDIQHIGAVAVKGEEK